VIIETGTLKTTNGHKIRGTGPTEAGPQKKDTKKASSPVGHTCRSGRGGLALKGRNRGISGRHSAADSRNLRPKGHKKS